MNRIKDYAGFAIYFAGLGYIVLCPLIVPAFGGEPFVAPILCREGALSLLDLLCNSTHPLQLPPGLHVMGILSAVLAAFLLLCRAIKRWRRAAAARASALATQMALTPASPPRKPVRPLRPVKPRTHFGLRGIPH